MHNATKRLTSTADGFGVTQIGFPSNVSLVRCWHNAKNSTWPMSSTLLLNRHKQLYTFLPQMHYIT